MPTWDAPQYLRFAGDRLRPARDLVAQIALDRPARIVDLGCGAGTSTTALIERWPQASIVGLDNAESMIAAARANYPKIAWEVADIATWKPAEPCGLIFSNAALHWVPDHANLIPRLFDSVSAGGALAFQMPANLDGPAHRAMQELGAESRWQGRLTHAPQRPRTEDASFYYDVFARLGAAVNLWTTEYLHVLKSTQHVVEWYKGSGLRPWLDALPTEALRREFIAEYSSRVAAAYPPRPDGKVLFPFQRLFVIAYR